VAYLNDEAVWEEGVRQLEPTDDCLADVFNEPLGQLTRRTKAVKQMVETESAARQAVADEVEENKREFVSRLNAVEGRGGPVAAHDFGSETPNDEELTQYACEAIWGAGGVFIWNADNSATSTYEVGGVVHAAVEIFNSTWVRNTYNGINHRIVLVNTPDTEPAIFAWEDVGYDTVGIADEEHAGLVKSGGDIAVDPVTGKVRISDAAMDKSGGSAALYDESKARNLLDVLGVRAEHSDEPATLEEAAEVMHILREKINADGESDFSGLRYADYLDLPSLNDGSTTYTWNAAYKNLRIMIAGFNIYKNAGDTENTKNHIVFTFRHCPLTRQMNTSNTNSGGYASSALAAYLEGDFKNGLKAVLGDCLYTIRRILSTKGSWSWNSDTVFLPTEQEIWGSVIWGEAGYSGGFQAQYPVYRESVIYKVKLHNGSRMWFWEATPYKDNTTAFCSSHDYGYAYGGTSASAAGGVAPAFCVA
jgi:hypothetical protein